MKPVLDWVKGNVVTVVLLVVMVGALVALPLVSRKLNASVRADVESRLQELKKLEALDKTTFEIGPISQKTLINPSLLERYRKVTGDERGDARQVVQLADRHNRKDRTVLLENVLPTMEPPSMRDVLPSEFHDALIAAYDDLLATVRAGEPPSPDDMAEEIKRKRIQFMSGHLQREEGDDLNDEEKDALRDHLTDARYKAYVAVAKEIGFYLSKSDLDLPAKNRVAPLTDLFEWQWQYWITEDILLALADANAGGSVLGEPVKRVLDLYIWPDSIAAAPAGRPGGRAGGGAAGGGGGGPGWGGGGGGGGAAPAPAAGPGGVNYGVSMTGRTSNDLYDVRRVRLSVIVENDRIPVVFDALARRNFITVLDVTMNPVDIYAAAADGFLYGRKPVSELVLDLETVWLRSWTSEFMPDAVKQARGIRDPAAPPTG